MTTPSDPPQLISEYMINEYRNQEADPEWLFHFFGVTAKQEPMLWKWFMDQIDDDLVRLMNKSPTSFMTPVFAPELYKILLRSMVRGYFMGMRKYEQSLEGMFSMVQQLPNEKPKIRPKKADKPPEDIGEINPDDLSP